MTDDTAGRMFLVKQFEAHHREIGPLNDPSAPTQHMVTLQVVSEVGGPDRVMASPLMFLNPQIAREVGQRLIQQAKLAMASDRGNTGKKRH